jgi:hypothetical protein
MRPQEKFVPDTSQLADSDIRLRILMDTGNWVCVPCGVVGVCV